MAGFQVTTEGILPNSKWVDEGCVFRLLEQVDCETHPPTTYSAARERKGSDLAPFLSNNM